MSGIRQSKAQQAREYVMAHPDETKEQQAQAAGVSTTLIARARAELIRENVFPGTRKSPASAPQPRPPAPDKPEKRTDPAAPIIPTKPASMLDHDAMEAMAAMIAEIETLDDVEVHRRLLKQCIGFAFNPRLHPDTRMSASQMWGKLRDQAKAKDLGPGAPVTFEDGVARLRDMMLACGAPMTLAAVNAAFDVKEMPGEGKVSADASAPAPGAAGTPAAP